MGNPWADMGRYGNPWADFNYKQFLRWRLELSSTSDS